MFPARITILFIGGALFFVLALGLSNSLRKASIQRPDLFNQLRDFAALPADRHSDLDNFHPVNPAEQEGKNEDPKDQEEEAVDWPDRPGDGTIADQLTPEQHKASDDNNAMEHHEVFSNMTTDSRRFTFDFLDQGSYNPSILPHPYKNNTWIAIAQRDKKNDDNTFWNVELVCEVTFVNNTMRCTNSPMILPIASNVSPECDGEYYSYMNDIIGPHDARIFYGPDKPYVIYGLQSEHSCLGQWLHDLRRLVYWSVTPGITNATQNFFWPTDLHRPPPYGKLEKNWFMFWDTEGKMYLHYNLKPNRIFAQLSPDGTVSEDIAPLAKSDKACLAKLMPFIRQNGLEWIHQGTNSLSVTMCRRSDPKCQKTEDNTFIMVLFQRKTFYYHGVYFPYMMLFRQTAPFEVYAISSKPIWYHGRGKPGGPWREGTWKPTDQSEMIFTTAMSWKERGMMYHGYLDDSLFVTFGIEDQNSGGIDVVAEDLLAGLSYCD